MLARVMLCLSLVLALPAAAETDYSDQRAEMLRVIAAHAEATAPLTGIEELDPRVLDAMGQVPRHAFVPEPLSPFAYLATPLPLGHGQNIASPYLVALMTHLADIQAGDKVFETGTGAGYHAAVMAQLGAEVVSVEVVRELADAARVRLAEAGVGKVETHIGDGYFGWPQGAPYDAIIVKEAVDHIPKPLLEQLAPDGRMVLPLGPLSGEQQLTVITKDGEGAINRKEILAVRFSPLQGGQRI